MLSAWALSVFTGVFSPSDTKLESKATRPTSAELAWQERGVCGHDWHGFVSQLQTQALLRPENARVLVAMNDTLSGDSLKLEASRRNLDSLVAMGTSLSTQSQHVAEAIQNLEIMDDFRTEVAAHVKSLEGVRRTMMDIAMMESTLSRVAQVVEPLTQIGNLRRLSDDEMREAARVILDRRVTRFSQSDSQLEIGAAGNEAAVTTTNSTNEEPVPLPPEAR